MNEHISVKELSEKLLEDYKTESSFFSLHQLERY